MRKVVIASLLLLAACGEQAETVSPPTDASRALDAQAVANGLLPSPDGRIFAGRYETRSDIGIDKFCAVGEGGSFEIGVLAVFGPESKCEAQGSAKFRDEKVQIVLSGKGSCTFEADFDGVVLQFPGKVPDGCANYCSPRASISGTQFYLVEQGSQNARRTLGREFEKLCG